MNEGTKPERTGQPVWSRARLVELAAEGASAVQAWALGRLERLGMEEGLEELFIDLLEHESSGIVWPALNALTRVGTPGAAAKLRARAERGDLAEPLRVRALEAAAALGDGPAGRALLDRIAQGAPYSLRHWVHRDAVGLTGAVRLRWADSALPPSCALLWALAAVGDPELATPLLMAAAGLEEEDAQMVLETAAETACGRVIPLPEMAERFGEILAQESEPADESLLAMQEQAAALGRALRRRRWRAARKAALETTRLVAAAALEDAPNLQPVRWALALAEAVDHVRLKKLSQPFLAGFAVGLFRGVLTSGRLAVELADEHDLRGLLDMLFWAGGAACEEVVRRVDALWQEARRDPETRRKAVETFNAWLEEEGGPSRQDRLWHIRELEGFPGAEKALELWEQRRTAQFEADYGDDFYEVFGKALMARPEFLRRQSGELLASDVCMVVTALEALAAQNEKRASEALLAALDSLLATSAQAEVWETLSEIGDVAALDRAIAEWRPGEAAISRCAGLLARLNGTFDQLPEEMRQEVVEAEAQWLSAPGELAGMLDSEELPSLPDGGTFKVHVRCISCGRRSAHEVERVYVDPWAREEGTSERESEIIPARIITCKYCGAVDQYELPIEENLHVMVHLVGLLAGEAPSTDDGPMVVGQLRLWDGTVVERPSAALDYLRRQAERDPRDGAGWRRVGNLLEKFGEPKQAEDAWRKAVRADKREVLAAFSLAELLWESEPEEAIAIGCKAVCRLPNATLQARDRRALAAQLVEMLRAFVAEAQVPLSLMAAWTGGVFGERVALNVSTVDLRRVKRWERLAELLGHDAFEQVSLSQDIPQDPPTLLEELINESRSLPRRATREAAPSEGSAAERALLRSEGGPGRNDPCPCASGRKYKHCCGRRA